MKVKKKTSNQLKMKKQTQISQVYLQRMPLVTRRNTDACLLKNIVSRGRFSIIPGESEKTPGV